MCSSHGALRVQHRLYWLNSKSGELEQSQSTLWSIPTAICHKHGCRFIIDSSRFCSVSLYCSLTFMFEMRRDVWACRLSLLPYRRAVSCPTTHLHVSCFLLLVCYWTLCPTLMGWHNGIIVGSVSPPGCHQRSFQPGEWCKHALFWLLGSFNSLEHSRGNNY